MSEPTNLSQKFAALQELMTTQYTELKAAIDALAGSGPENTLKSVNESLWNLAGPAPGVNLVQLKAAIDALAGTGPENTLKSVNQSLWNLAGPAPGVNLVQLKAAIDALYGLFNPGQGITPYNLLDSMYMAITASGLTETATKDILVRLIAQFDTSVVTPTMKDLVVAMRSLLENINSQQAQLVENTRDVYDVPIDCCETPFRSIGSTYVSVTAQLIEPMNYATWPTTVPVGFDITSEPGGMAIGQTILRCTDWSQYRVYVASNASQFGVVAVNLQRFSTNEWITLAGNTGFEFFVNGSEKLDVYICPISTSSAVTAPDCMVGQYTVQLPAWSDLGLMIYGVSQYHVYTPVPPSNPVSHSLTTVSSSDNTRHAYASLVSENLFFGWNFPTVHPHAILIGGYGPGSEFSGPVDLELTLPVDIMSGSLSYGCGQIASPVSYVEIYVLFAVADAATTPPPNFFISG